MHMIFFAMQQVGLAGLLALVLIEGLPAYAPMGVLALQVLYLVQFSLAQKD
jgi:hypothetical protein